MAAERSGGRTLEPPAFLGILIGVVPAVVLAIALPAERFTEGVVTLEFILRALTFSSVATILLIASIHAVRVSVTPPAVGNAVTALTLVLVVVTLQITTVLI